MKFFSALLKKIKKEPRIRRSDSGDKVLFKQGQEQFKTLLKKGLSIPVTFL